MSGEKTSTKSERMRKIDLTMICGWIVKVWEDIPSDIIKRAFLKCCISNNMDDTEDDIIWEEELQMMVTATGSCSTLIRTKSYMPSSTRKALTRITLDLAEKLHQTQTALFRATNPQEICMILV